MKRFLLLFLLLSLLACTKNEPLYPGRRGPLVAVMNEGIYTTKYTYDNARRIIGIYRISEYSEAATSTISYNGSQVEIGISQQTMQSGKIYETCRQHIILQLNMLGRVVSGSFEQAKRYPGDTGEPTIIIPATGEITVTYNARGQLESYAEKQVETFTRYADDPSSTQIITSNYRHEYTWLEGTIATTTTTSDVQTESGKILSEWVSSKRHAYYAQQNTTNSDFNITSCLTGSQVSLLSELGLLGNLCPYVLKIVNYNDSNHTSQFTYKQNEAGHISGVFRENSLSHPIWEFTYY